MFKKIWEIIKTPFRWIKNGWNWLEKQVAKIAPGLKTQILAGLGIAAEGFAIMREYIEGLPMEKFVTGTTASIVGITLFTLAFWTRHISSRVANR